MPGSAYPPPNYAGGTNPGYTPSNAYSQTAYVVQPANNYYPPAGSNPDSAPVSSNRVRDAEAPSFAASGFNDKAIRHRFVRKVYLILTCQLAVTLGFIAFFLFHKPTQKWVQNNLWFYFLAYIIFIGTYIAIICCKNVRRKSPGNYIALTIFTLVFSYVAATISSYHDIEAVLIAMAITLAVCVAVTLFSIQTKIDFTRCGGLLFCLLIVLLLFGISVMIVMSIPSIEDKTKHVLQIVYGTLGALVFSLFLAYDTQMIVGGKKYEYSEEDYISASVQLYLDVVYIFLFMLMAMGGGK